MRKSRSIANTIGLFLSVAIGLSTDRSHADPAPDADDLHVQALHVQDLQTENLRAQASRAQDLQLEVFINGEPRNLIASFRQNADGTFSISARQFRNIGLVPAANATSADGYVLLERLSNVSYRYDAARQTIHFTASDDARVVRIIDMRRKDRADLQPVSGTGALVNYTIYGSLQSDPRQFGRSAYRGVSGYFDSRVFSPHGTLTNSVIGRVDQGDELPNFTRLDTRWSYSDPDSLTTTVVGDFITRGPSWARPVRMGGFQRRHNFSIRPDLITMPVPNLSGSAAVPSSVDVLVNNSRVYSGQVGSGPFRVDNLPVVTGQGTARLLIRDALGRETVQDVAYYASPDLLRPGLTDYSFEAGFARRWYGIESNSYDKDPMLSGSGRVGVSDTFTLEAHAEATDNLVNGGVGGVFGLGTFGIGSLAFAASNHRGGTGFLANASIEARSQNFSVYLRSQRTFGDYIDLAAVSASSSYDAHYPGQWLALPPKAIDQVSLSLPLGFDRSSVNLSFTHLETAIGDTSRIFGLSYSRAVLANGNVFVSAYKDIDRESYGVFGGLSFALNDQTSAMAAVQSLDRRPAFTAEAMRQMSGAVHDYGWRLRGSTDDASNAVAAAYRLPSARIEAGVQGGTRSANAFGQVDGAVVMMEKDIFLTNKIDDAFAVVDVGAPDVTVSHQNRVAGTTNASGKVLVPALQSWIKNEIAVDPATLPIDIDLERVRQKVVPAQQSGVTVKFEARPGNRSALVSLRGADGRFIEVGSTASREGGAGSWVVGYDGQVFITDVEAANTIVVDQPNGRTCRASFPFEHKPGELARIENVICR
ncbi:fimbria/pilus outer membrane usher protein [Pseudorhodoplanes sp.]|uniref:fimbria/pilus outer membrane usher protein n=1 Tax=Pseudorhodoplanes sp. TaxID=1934341 RepID=UPI002CFC3E00|nr:fimbria/pilus outer membrane usher protein [Pseudorhodoplanes sp.]HWV53630.1 fimbria/pilus outer membrane usher protein [Pseudorhodoplanes sp.]